MSQGVPAPSCGEGWRLEPRRGGRGGGRWGQRGVIVITLCPLVQGKDEAVAAADGGPAAAERDPPARRRSPRSPQPCRRQPQPGRLLHAGHVPGQGAREEPAWLISAGRDRDEHGKEPRAAGAAAGCDGGCPGDFSGLVFTGRGGAGLFFVSFLSTELCLKGSGRRAGAWGVAAEGCCGPAGERSGAGGQERKQGENGGKCRSAGARREPERGQAQETGRGGESRACPS